MVRIQAAMTPHFERGQVLFDLKRYREAVAAYRAHLASSPDDPHVLALLAAALINLNRVRDAERAVRRSLQLDPELAYAHYVLSFVYERARMLPPAERAIAESVRLLSSPEAFHRWAEISVKRGRSAEALVATQKALELNPEYNPAILLRGKLLAGMGKLEEAHALYCAALARNPEDASAHHALGALVLRTGDADAALGMLREARRLDPVQTNDARSIARAYGRIMRPLWDIDRFVLRWPNWSPKKRWLLFTALAAFSVNGSLIAGVNLERAEPNPLWCVVNILLANYLLLPFTFDFAAEIIGFTALRREFRASLLSALTRPTLLAAPLAGHLLMSIGAVVLCIPCAAVIVCLFGACFPLIGESIKPGAGRFTGYVCIPVLFALMIFGALCAVLVDLDGGPMAALVCAIVFGAAFFSDKLARWVSSWRFRRSPLLDRSLW